MPCPVPPFSRPDTTARRFFRMSGVIGFFLILLHGFPVAANDQPSSPERFTLNPPAPRQTISLVDKGWRYKAGDGDGWAATDLDAADWTVLPRVNRTQPTELPGGWSGQGWYRLRLTVSPDAAGFPFALQMKHNGASLIFLDGKPLASQGSVAGNGMPEIPHDPNLAPIPLVFDHPGEHVIAIRRSAMEFAPSASFLNRWATAGGTSVGFYIGLARLDDGLRQESEETSERMKWAILLSLIGAFGLLHLILFLFNRRQTGHLYFSFYALGILGAQTCSLTIEHGHSSVTADAILFAAQSLLGVVAFANLLMLVYATFSPKRPRYFLPFIAVYGVATLARLLFPHLNRFWVIPSLMEIAVGLEVIRVFLLAVFHRKEGAWIIGPGVFLFGLIVATDTTMTILREWFRISTDQWWTTFDKLLLFYPPTLLILTSVHLARQMSRTNRDLETKLVEVRELSEKTLDQERRETRLRLEQARERERLAHVEAENARRAEELEEARQLQLSMLPKQIPEIPGFEIATFMRTATEVGGDYYDFAPNGNGGFTVVIGDATGHGLRAGTMVTAAKSLFNAFGNQPHLPDILGTASAALKKLNFRGLYMALTILRVSNDGFCASAAGMPPILVFRAKQNRVEEIEIGGMPLGASLRAVYDLTEARLDAGDVLVLMSDGLPERLDAQENPFGYENTRECLRSVGHQPPAAIVERLLSESDRWAGGQPPDDDLTIVVIRKIDPTTAPFPRSEAVTESVSPTSTRS